MQRPTVSSPGDFGLPPRMHSPGRSILAGGFSGERCHPSPYRGLLHCSDKPGSEEETPAESVAGMPGEESLETGRGTAPPRGQRRGLPIHGLFSDTVVVTGASLIVFSIALVVLIFVTALPTSNPYIGMFLFVLLPVVALVGFLLFIFGVFLSREGGTSGNAEGERHAEDGPP